MAFVNDNLLSLVYSSSSSTSLVLQFVYFVIISLRKGIKIYFALLIYISFFSFPSFPVHLFDRELTGGGRCCVLFRIGVIIGAELKFNQRTIFLSFCALQVAAINRVNFALTCRWRGNIRFFGFDYMRTEQQLAILVGWFEMNGMVSNRRGKNGG